MAAQTATSFIGRKAELGEIVHRLALPDCRLLTLVGPGGIGKTRLALEVARLQSEPFADGTHFVPLQPLSSPDLIVPAMVDVLGITLDGELDARHQLLHYLATRQILLVLDNFEHLLDGVSTVSDALDHAPRVKILVTSRERLNLRGEWLYPVNGMAFPSDAGGGNLESYDAARLFIRSARRLRPDFAPENEANHICRICALLDGMPLALELAAAWVRFLPCSEIALEIQRGLDFLAGSARDTPPRHQSIRAVFEQSWHGLTGDERDVLMKLSVFRGGFTREAAVQVAGASLQSLSSMVDKSLLRHRAGRYDLHELLRQYAEEKLREVNRDEAACDAHSAYFAAYLQQRWKPLRTDAQAKILNDIEVEFENVRTAWNTMAERGKTSELSLSVYSLWLYCELRGRYFEAIDLLRRAEDALALTFTDNDVNRTVGQIKTRLGWFYVFIVRLEEARTLVEEGLTTLQRVGSPEDVALAYYSLSLIEAFYGNADALRRCAEHQAEIAEQLGDDWLLAAALLPLANSALIAGNFEEAKPFVHRFCQFSKRCGDTHLQATSYHFSAYVANHERNYAESKHFSEQALLLFEAIGQASEISITYTHLGYLAVCMNEYLAAQAYYEQALRILLNTGGFTHYIMDILKNISEMWIMYGKQAAAVKILSLIAHHPETFSGLRNTAEFFLSQLRQELQPDLFAAAEREGRHLELRRAAEAAIQELSHKGHLSTPASADNILNKRELEVLTLVADGLSNPEIADRLFLANSTVKWYVSEILGKLHARSRSQAVAQARARGLL
jgi:predicted ATPase/DNA-binding NarL/FixJ family response regulator